MVYAQSHRDDHTGPKPEGLDVETTAISVKKIWEGEALQSVTINLLADGKKVKSVVLSQENNWEHTFDGLDKLNSEGKDIIYTVEEVEIGL